MKRRSALTISGDLHAVGIGKILRAGSLRLDKNPVTAALSGPIGTAPGAWPSAFRGVGSTPPQHLDVREEVPPIEQLGFTIADFLPDRIRLRFFKWDLKPSLWKPSKALTRSIRLKLPDQFSSFEDRAKLTGALSVTSAAFQILAIGPGHPRSSHDHGAATFVREDTLQ
ncbi:MAG TPA: hypothetical protein VGN17_10595 [Bryobacteraceae bacterium]